MSEAPPQFSQSSGVFSWIIPAVKSRRTLKTWIRCCVTLCATLILMVDNKTLGSLGQAGFFGAIVAVMVPPSLALSLFVLAVITLLLGMLLGWAWGAAAMASALSVRSQALLAQQQQHAQASLVQGIPPALQLQKFVFQGMFLDPRSTAVYGVFFFIGTFALGTLRAFIPKLTLLSIFGSIVLDIICTYGPLFPTPQYTLPKLFIIPTCYYVAIAIASLVLIFPESLNRIWLSTLRNNFLEPISKLIAIQTQALQSRPSDSENWAKLTDQSYAVRQALVAGTQGLLGQIGTTDLEVSVGRLGSGDLRRINNELKSLMFRAAGLHAFLIFVNNTNIAEEKDRQTDEKLRPPEDRYTILQRHVRKHEVKHGHDLNSLIPILEQSSTELRSACEDAVKGTSEWFGDCNSGRWAGFFSRLDKNKIEERHRALVTHLTAVQDTLEQYRQVERVKLLKPFEKFFDLETGKKIANLTLDRHTEIFAARSLFICFVYSYALDAFADRLTKLLAILVDLDGKRPKPRLWAPSGFGKLGRKLLSKHDIDNQIAPVAMGTSNDPTKFSSGDESEESVTDSVMDDNEATASPQRNPDALPPTTAFGRIFLKVGSIFRFFRSPEGIFGLRHAVVSVALWIPSVCSSSAWFYYGNRGIWALIMAQTALAVYAGDQIFGFFVRIGGTILGLLVGMAVWYIGAGHGDGNPYGIVIATTAFTAPFLLGRLAAPPQQMMLWTLAGVTIVFIVGYSWIDRHLPVLVSAGVGVGLGWKRALLVVIGFTAAFIVMLFPRPTSSRTLVRETLAATTGEIGHILAVEIEALLAEEARARAGYHEKVTFVGEHSDEKASPKERRVRKIAQKVLNVVERLQALAPSLQTARLEPQLQGTWPYDKYAHLYSTQMKLLSSLVLFTGAFTHLDTKWCSILVHRTPLLNPNFLSDIFSNLSILSYALTGAHPLPASLSKLRDRLIYHQRLVAPGNTQSSNPQPAPSEEESDDSSSEEDVALEFATGRLDGPSMGFDDFSLSLLMDEQLPAHSTALVALSNVVFLVDEMSMTIRDLCGETTFRGFDELQKDFLGREEKAIGTKADFRR